MSASSSRHTCFQHSIDRPAPCCTQGALLCLAAATVGLGEPSEAYLRQIVPPVLASFTDQDSRVRYYACEALYNIAKVPTLGFLLWQIAAHTREVVGTAAVLGAHYQAYIIRTGSCGDLELVPPAAIK
eukprot:GHUV01050676.1.p1 GENE.GHUV01050676.1~~GHUV01050676.1.p1  ORF type:complete len:128 (-),score=37.15 GHUV01050676.1:4-387(-)